VFLGAAIMLVATALQTASQSVHMFIGARFLIGFGLAFAGELHLTTVQMLICDNLLKQMRLLC
jgi:hypothetical protein